VCAVAVTVRKENMGVALCVKDSGVGFDPADKHIFYEKFYRGDNVRRMNVNYGTGISLYICKKFIEEHRSRIWGESEGPASGVSLGFGCRLSSEQWVCPPP
jgi:signal transduction histidine kinase